MDYLLPMGYYRVQENVMSTLDPTFSSLRPLKGALVGPNWNIAFADPAKWALNGSTSSGTLARVAAWQRMYKGDVNYEQLPSLYRQAKIVLDDSNNATMPWGSVNSRVFDALAAGALVVTNGESGLLSSVT